MSDNTVLNAGTGGDTYAADDITDGGVAQGAKAQRIKLGFGADGFYSDVTGSMPLPVYQPGTSIAGSITVLDSVTNYQLGSAPQTAPPTAGSFVAAELKGAEATATFAMQDGSGSAVYCFEMSNDSTDGSNGEWASMNAINYATGALVSIAAAQGVFVASVGGARWVRIRCVSGTIAVVMNVRIRLSMAPRGFYLNNPLPPGTAVIGAVRIDQNNQGVYNAVTAPDLVITGNIATQNANPLTGTATAGSTITLGPLFGQCQISIEALGTITSALSVQVSGSGATWETNSLATALTRTATGAQAATITVAGLYEFNAGGGSYVRVSALLAWASGTANIRMSASRGTGLVALDSPVPAGANTIGAISNVAAIAAGANLTMDVGLGARATANGLTSQRIFTSSGGTVSGVPKGSAARLYSVSLCNDTASKIYLKFFNKATAPILGTDSPILTIMIPVGGTYDRDWSGYGRYFSLGLGYAVTGGIADLDSTSVAAGVTGEFMFA